MGIGFKTVHEPYPLVRHRLTTLWGLSIDIKSYGACTIFNHFIVLNSFLDHVSETLIRATDSPPANCVLSTSAPTLRGFTDAPPHPPAVSSVETVLKRPAGWPLPSSPPFHLSHRVVSKGCVWPRAEVSSPTC